MIIAALSSTNVDGFTRPTATTKAADAVGPASVAVSGGATNTTASTTVSLSYASEDSEEYKAVYNMLAKTRTGPSLAAYDSLKTIEDRLGKFEKSLAASRPDLAKSDWDITVTDGKLKVTGDISADDKATMETRLNKDQALVRAVQTYMSAARDYLETTELNQAYTGKNGYTGQTMLYNFADVDKQLEGKIAFKDLIATSWRMYADPNGGPRTEPGTYRGAKSLEILASKLTSTPLSAT